MSLPSLRPADRRGLADEAADRIREAVFNGHFPPGAPLREVELAASLGVSRGSVREGLARLEREGLIRGGWHRGAAVIEVTAEAVQEVYAVRGALDRLAALTAREKEAALTAREKEHATREKEHAARAEQHAAGEKQLGALVDAMAEEVAGAARGARLLELDIAFHDAIYAKAGNTRLTAAWQAVRSQVWLFQSRRIALSLDHYRARVVAEHRELARLLRDGDPDTLARAAEEHVDSARRGLLKSLLESRVDSRLDSRLDSR